MYHQYGKLPLIQGNLSLKTSRDGRLSRLLFMARSSIATDPGQGPGLLMVGTGSVRVPVTSILNSGTWKYSAGVSGSVALQATARPLSFVCVGGVGGGYVKINDGDNIPVAEGASLGVGLDSDVMGATFVFANTEMYFLQYVIEPA